MKDRAITFGTIAVLVWFAWQVGQSVGDWAEYCKEQNSAAMHGACDGGETITRAGVTVCDICGVVR